MSETTTLIICFIQGLVLSVGCFFYGLGGRNAKWRRRYLASLVCSISIWIGVIATHRFNAYFLLVYPLLALAFSLGYGGETLCVKILKRSLVVACTCITGAYVCILLGENYLRVFPVQAILGAITVWLGVRNPVPAPIEEFFIALLLTESIMIFTWL